MKRKRLGLGAWIAWRAVSWSAVSWSAAFWSAVFGSAVLWLAAAAWAWEPGKPISPARFPRKPTSKIEKLPDGGMLIVYQDGSRVWVKNRTAQPLYFEPGEKLPADAKLPEDEAPAKDATQPKPEPTKPDNDPTSPTAPPADDDSASVAAARKTWPAAGVLRPATRRVRALAFTSDNRQLVVGLHEKKVVVFDVASRQPVREIASVYGPAVLLVPGLRPNAMYVVEGPFLRLTDLTAARDLQTYGSNSGASANGFVSADNALVLASSAGGVEFLRTDLRESTQTLVPSEPPTRAGDFKSSAAAYSAKEKLAASGRPNGKIYVWSLRGAEPAEIAAIPGHTGQIEGLEFVAGNLLSLGREGHLKLWSLKTREVIDTVSLDAEQRRGWLLDQGRLLATVATEPGSPLQLRSVTIEGDKLRLSLLGEVSNDSLSMEERIATPDRVQISELALSNDGTLLAVALQGDASTADAMRVAIFELPKQASARNEPAKRAPAAEAAEFRTWTSKDGKFQVEAKLVGVAGPTIRLERKDNGKVIAVALDQLSAADQALAKAAAAKN